MYPLPKDSAERADALKYWCSFFEMRKARPDFVHRISLMHVSRADIFTANLRFTRHFCMDLASRKIVGFGLKDREIDFGRALDILALIHTHQRLALCNAAPMAAPAFWVSFQGSVLPALPFEHLLEGSRLSGQAVKMIISALVQDGALRRASSPECAHAVVAMPGFLPEGNIHHMLRS